MRCNTTVKGLAERLYDCIMSSEMTVMELSRKTGISRNHLYYYMNGDCTPSAGNLAKLCRVLDVSADWLLFGEEMN